MTAFLPDPFSLLDGSIEAGQLIASSQATDNYLLVLAASRQAQLATFDRKIVPSVIVDGAEIVFQVP